MLKTYPVPTTCSVNVSYYDYDSSVTAPLCLLHSTGCHKPELTGGGQ